MDGLKPCVVLRPLRFVTALMGFAGMFCCFFFYYSQSLAYNITAHRRWSIVTYMRFSNAKWWMLFEIVLWGADIYLLAVPYQTSNGAQLGARVWGVLRV